MTVWNSSIKLPTGKKTKTDEDGFSTETFTFLEGIPANFKDVTRNDLILANQDGYQADVLIEIMNCNYSGQSWLVDEQTGQEYGIKRTFGKDKSNLMQLTCERRERGG